VEVFLFVFVFNGEVGKVLSILPTLRSTLEKHHIYVQCGPSWEGGGTREGGCSFLQSDCTLLLKFDFM